MAKYSVLDWVDDVLKDYIEFMEIARVEDIEFEKFYKLLRAWNDNLYPTTANEEGIERFEALFDITPAPGASLEDRRYEVLVKFNTRLPYTEVQLRRILNRVLGVEGYTLRIKSLILDLSLTEGNNSKVQTIVHMLNEIVPMNIMMKIHQYLERHGTIYTAGYVKIGKHIKVNPYTVGSFEVKRSKLYSGGCVRVGYRLRTK